MRLESLEVLLIFATCDTAGVVRRVWTRNLVIERLATKGEDAVWRRINCRVCVVESYKLTSLKHHKGVWDQLQVPQCNPCGLEVQASDDLKEHKSEPVNVTHDLFSVKLRVPK